MKKRVLVIEQTDAFGQFCFELEIKRMTIEFLYHFYSVQSGLEHSVLSKHYMMFGACEEILDTLCPDESLVYHLKSRVKQKQTLMSGDAVLRLEASRDNSTR